MRSPCNDGAVLDTADLSVLIYTKGIRSFTTGLFPGSLAPILSANTLWAILDGSLYEPLKLFVIIRSFIDDLPSTRLDNSSCKNSIEPSKSCFSNMIFMTPPYIFLTIWALSRRFNTIPIDFCLYFVVSVSYKLPTYRFLLNRINGYRHFS